MTQTPRRPVNAMDAAEALFKKPAPKAEVVAKAPVVPGAKEMVSIRLDKAVLEHFQEAGPGWQDRINEVLRAAVDRGEA